MSERRPGARAVIVSIAVHGVLLVPLVVFARPPAPIEFETVKVNLVSPPPAEMVQAEPEPAPSLPQPEPEPAQETPEPEVQARDEPPPEPERDVERPDTEKPPETPERRPEPKRTEESPQADAGGDDLDIATEGREFPFPDYVANVIVQVKRYFRWTDDSHPQGEIYFEIMPDGSVRNLRMTRSSGNIRFDFAVQGAVETAGTRGAFGPLPDGYVGPFLPVRVVVEPPR